MTRMRHRTLAIVVVLFVVLPVTEIFLLVQLGQLIGVLPVLGLVVVEAIVGGWLIRRRWRSALAAVRGRTESGVLTGPTGLVPDATDTGVFVAGGIALIFPGLITDLVALICLIPFTRRLPRTLLDRAIRQRIDRLAQFDPSGRFGGSGQFGGMPSGFGGRSRTAHDDVIEGEVVEPDADPTAPSSTPDPVVIRGEIIDR